MRTIRSIVCILTLSLPALSLAHTEHPHQREHGRHVHGEAEANLAGVAMDVMLTLVIPAGDILGFERAPATAEEESELAAHLEWLKHARWLTEETARTCQATQRHAHTPLLEPNHSGHADIEIEILWQCKEAGPRQLDTTSFLARYSKIERINLQWLTDTNSGQTTLNTAESRFWLHSSN